MFGHESLSTRDVANCELAVGVVLSYVNSEQDCAKDSSYSEPNQWTQA